MEKNTSHPTPFRSQKFFLPAAFLFALASCSRAENPVANAEPGLAKSATCPAAHEDSAKNSLSYAFTGVQKNLREIPPTDPLFDLLSEVTPIEAYTQRLHFRLTGSSIPFTHPRFRRAVNLIRAGQFNDAALLMTEEENFLRVRMRNFASPFTNKDFATTEPFNDLQALIIGVTRDGLDARLILTGNLRYAARGSAGLPAYSPKNNDHYLGFDNAILSLQNDLQRFEPQTEGAPAGVGALTSRTWSKLSYDAGTNRRAIKYSFDAFLCAPIESWKFRGVPDFYVRRDVDRAIGGSPKEYQNNCRSCHAIMDGLDGAFAKVDFVDGEIKVGELAAKMNQNATTYPEGSVVLDDSYVNLMNYNTSVDFGWRSEMQGQGLAEFATMMANSKAFSRCMVRRVFTEVCGNLPEQNSAQLIEVLSQNFETDSYNMKNLFVRVATNESCEAHPKGDLQ